MKEREWWHSVYQLCALFSCKCGQQTFFWIVCVEVAKELISHSGNPTAFDCLLFPGYDLEENVHQYCRRMLTDEKPNSGTKTWYVTLFNSTTFVDHARNRSVKILPERSLHERSFGRGGGVEAWTNQLKFKARRGAPPGDVEVSNWSTY